MTIFVLRAFARSEDNVNTDQDAQAETKPGRSRRGTIDSIVSRASEIGRRELPRTAKIVTAPTGRIDSWVGARQFPIRSEPNSVHDEVL